MKLLFLFLLVSIFLLQQPLWLLELHIWLDRITRFAYGEESISAIFVTHQILLQQLLLFSNNPLVFRKINSYFPFQYCAKFIKKRKSFFSTGPSGAAIAAQSATGTACTTDFVTVMSPLWHCTLCQIYYLIVLIAIKWVVDFLTLGFSPFPLLYPTELLLLQLRNRNNPHNLIV